MARKKVEGNTRQIYAAISEDLYLAAKGRAAEMRVPLRELIEMGLKLVLQDDQGSTPDEGTATDPAPSIWDDEYLRIQAQQPVGSPVELAGEEAQRVVRATFGSDSGSRSPADVAGPVDRSGPGREHHDG